MNKYCLIIISNNGTGDMLTEEGIFKSGDGLTELVSHQLPSE